MTTAKRTRTANPLAGDFPVIVEKGEPQAVVVDIKVFRQLQILVDNWLNREPEPEDALWSASEMLRQMIATVEAEVRQSPPTDWREALRAL